MSDLSWPHVKDEHPTPDERAERALNLIFGRDMWSPFAKYVIALEIRAAMNETMKPYIGGE